MKFYLYFYMKRHSFAEWRFFCLIEILLAHVFCFPYNMNERKCCCLQQKITRSGAAVLRAGMNVRTSIQLFWERNRKTP